MSAQQCAAVTAPNTLWSFCPSIGAAYAFAVFFGLTLIAHIAQGVLHRKAYSWVIAMSALWQLLTYTFRILSVQNPANDGQYTAWFVLILLAPLWTNAYVYMVLGRMVWIFTQKAKVFGITAWHFTKIFVLLDVIAFVVQAYGAASTQRNGITDARVLDYLHVYMVGVGIQQAFILVFLVYAIGFHRQLIHGGMLDHKTKQQAMALLCTLYTCIALITMRIIFSICEYAKGFESTMDVETAVAEGQSGPMHVAPGELAIETSSTDSTESAVAFGESQAYAQENLSILAFNQLLVFLCISCAFDLCVERLKWICT